MALRLLKEQGIQPKFTYVVTSPEALGEWQELKLPYQWILCYEEEIVDIDAIEEKMRLQLEGLLRDHIVILDCTSATKPATIAYYELARSIDRIITADEADAIIRSGRVDLVAVGRAILKDPDWASKAVSSLIKQ